MKLSSVNIPSFEIGNFHVYFIYSVKSEQMTLSYITGENGGLKIILHFYELKSMQKYLFCLFFEKFSYATLQHALQKIKNK